MRNEVYHDSFNYYIIAILVLVSPVLATTGVVSFHNTKDQTGVTIDKKELKEKDSGCGQEGGRGRWKFSRRPARSLRKAADEMRGSSHDQMKPPTKTPPADETDKNPQQPESR